MRYTMTKSTIKRRNPPSDQEKKRALGVLYNALLARDLLVGSRDGGQRLDVKTDIGRPAFSVEVASIYKGVPTYKVRTPYSDSVITFDEGGAGALEHLIKEHESRGPRKNPSTSRTRAKHAALLSAGRYEDAAKVWRRSHATQKRKNPLSPYAKMQRKAMRAAGIKPAPKPKFKIGYWVEDIDGSGIGTRPGRVEFIGSYDDYMGGYRYKVREPDGKVLYRNEPSLRRIRAPRAIKKNPLTSGLSGTYAVMHANPKVSDDKVISAFLHRQPAESKYLESTGSTIRMFGMGSDHLAAWMGDQIRLGTPHGTITQSYIKKIAKRAPAYLLTSDSWWSLPAKTVALLRKEGRR